MEGGFLAALGVVGSGVPCLSSKMSEMPSKLAFEWSCASKIRSAHESINDECTHVDGTESQPGHNTHKPGGIPNFGIKNTDDSRIFDSWFGTIPFQSLKRTTRTMVTAKLTVGSARLPGHMQPRRHRPPEADGWQQRPRQH